MLKIVRPSEIKPGMYVVSYGAGTFDDPVVAVERLVLSADVGRYVSLASTAVLVDTERSAPVAEIPARERPVLEPLAALQDELPVALRLHAQAVALVRGLLEAARAGRVLDFSPARPLTGELAQSLERNEAASITARLRRPDEPTAAHCANVAVLSLLLGRHLGFAGGELENLGLAGLLHDIGKARIPEAVLNKPGRLNETEMDVARRHALEGYLLLKDRDDVPAEVARAVLEHHERTDGRGYPYRLAGADIALVSQVVGLADVFDAMTSEKTYRLAMPPAMALSLLYKDRNKGYCTQCVDVLVRALGVYPVGSFVRLTSGEYGLVAEGNPGQPLLPRVRLIFDARMKPRRAMVLDLAGPGSPEGLGIMECLNPALYKIDVSRFLL